MSRNSYPSPVSSSSTFDLEDSASSFAVVTPEPARQERVDTHRNLHQASAALEDAYRRIRRARRNLLELTETRALHDAQIRTSDQNEFNPGYEAITLTSDQDLDTNSYIEEDELELPDTEGLLRRFDPGLDFQHTDRSLFYDTMSSNSTGPSSLAPSHPPSIQLPTPGTYIHPSLHHRRSQLESQLTRRRELLHNDPTTTIGRRVAAREAGSTSLASYLASWDGASARIMTVIERDIERIRAATRQRRSEPARQELQTIGTAARLNRILDVDTGRRGIRNQTTAGTTSSTPPLGTSIESRRWRPGRVYPSPPQSPMSNQSGRLSILSNLPVQNLTTPGSAISRPLLFDEPLFEEPTSSYISAADFTRPAPNVREEQNGPVGERSYVIRRTINADGEEHVHPINFEWSDEEVSPWALPRGQSDDVFVDYMSPPRSLRARPIRYVQRSDAIQNSQVEGNTSPRRWARLDADGNEITSDEEEDLEHVRRSDPEVPSRSSLVPSVDGVDVRTRLHHPLDSNTNISQGGDFADGPLHSELELHDQERWNAVDVPVVSCDNQPCLQRQASRGPPFSPNPLPMPLEDMMIASKKSQSSGRPRIIRVARHANDAGR